MVAGLRENLTVSEEKKGKSYILENITAFHSK